MEHIQHNSYLHICSPDLTSLHNTVHEDKTTLHQVQNPPSPRLHWSQRGLPGGSPPTEHSVLWPGAPQDWAALLAAVPAGFVAGNGRGVADGGSGTLSGALSGVADHEHLHGVPPTEDQEEPDDGDEGQVPTE